MSLFFLQQVEQRKEFTGGNVVGKGTFRSARSNNKIGRGIYAMVVSVGEVTSGTTNQNISSARDNSKPKTTYSQYRLGLVVVNLDKVPVDILGDFVSKTSSSSLAPYTKESEHRSESGVGNNVPDEHFGRNSEEVIGNMFERTRHGNLRLRYYLDTIAGEKVGSTMEMPVLFDPSEEKFSLKVGFQFAPKMFVPESGVDVKVGDILELVGWKLIISKQKYFINSNKSGNHWKETEMFPLCFRTGTLFSYANGGRLPPTLNNLTKTNICSVESHNDGNSVLPEGRLRRIHKGNKWESEVFFLNVVSTATSATFISKDGKGSKIQLNAVPCHEYDREHEEKLVALKLIPQGSVNSFPILDDKTYKEAWDLYYDSYCTAILTNPPNTIKDIVKEGGIPKEKYISWQAHISLITWGSHKDFWNPDYRSPIRTDEGQEVNMQTGLITNRDGTVDYYQFSRQILEVSIDTKSLTLLGPKSLESMAQLLLSHRIGFHMLLQADAMTSVSASSNVEVPEMKGDRWKRNLDLDEQESIKISSEAQSHDYTHGLIKAYASMIHWQLPEYLELKGIEIPLSLMEHIYEQEKTSENPIHNVYSEDNVFHQSKNGQLYTYLNAAAKSCPFTDFSEDYIFYALPCPVPIVNGNKTAWTKSLDRLEAITNLSKSPEIELDEKIEKIKEYFESCTWETHYYAVNKKLLRMCRTEAKASFFRTVDKIRSKKEGTYFNDDGTLAFQVKKEPNEQGKRQIEPKSPGSFRKESGVLPVITGEIAKGPTLLKNPLNTTTTTTTTTTASNIGNSTSGAKKVIAVTGSPKSVITQTKSPNSSQSSGAVTSKSSILGGTGNSTLSGNKRKIPETASNSITEKFELEVKKKSKIGDNVK